MKKAQTWYMDIFIGILIFIISFTIFIKSYVNLNSSDEDQSALIELEGNLISEMLMSEGSPSNWTSSDVIQLGILTDNRIDEQKIIELDSMNYNNTKTIFRTKFDYYFFLQNSSDIVMVNGKNGTGKQNINPDNIIAQEDPKNLLKITRLSVYNSEIVRLTIYIWDQK